MVAIPDYLLSFVEHPLFNGQLKIRIRIRSSRFGFVSIRRRSPPRFFTCSGISLHGHAFLIQKTPRGKPKNDRAGAFSFSRDLKEKSGSPVRNVRIEACGA
jgi:hypothetical protein